MGQFSKQHQFFGVAQLLFAATQNVRSCALDYALRKFNEKKKTAFLQNEAEDEDS